MMFVVDADNTLAEAWEELAQSLLDSGAQEYQIDAMKMTFFMGAAQTHIMIDADCRGSREEFIATMDSIDNDLVSVLRRHGGSQRSGHA